MATKNFIEELEWRGMIHTIMPGAKEQLEKEMTTARIRLHAVSGLEEASAMTQPASFNLRIVSATPSYNSHSKIPVLSNLSRYFNTACHALSASKPYFSRKTGSSGGPIKHNSFFRSGSSIPKLLNAYCTHFVIPSSELMIVPSRSNKTAFIILPLFQLSK